MSPPKKKVSKKPQRKIASKKASPKKAARKPASKKKASPKKAPRKVASKKASPKKVASKKASPKAKKAPKAKPSPQLDAAAIQAAAKARWDEWEAGREDREAAAARKEKGEDARRKKRIAELEASGYSGGDPLTGLRVFEFIADYSKPPRLTEPPFWATDIHQNKEKTDFGMSYFLNGVAAAPNDQIVEAWLRSLGPLHAGPPADDFYTDARGWRHDVWISVEDLETSPDGGGNPRAAMIDLLFGKDYKEQIAPLLPPNLL
jgi:hypothetical protein